MKLATIASAVVAALSVVPLVTAAPVLVPDGDFSEEGIGFWDEGGAPNTVFRYPTTGGNPDSYGIMENDGGGFGVLVAALNVFEEGSARIPLDELGITPGLEHDFFLDMIRFTGTNIGGLKLEFYRDNQVAAVEVTPDMREPLIGDGTTWETYTFSVVVPDDADSVIFVPLWGVGSTIGYDNVGVDNVGRVPDGEPVIIPPLPNNDFETPGGASWAFFGDGSLGAPHSVSYPATGGNPGGHALMDTSGGGGFAVIVANSNATIPYENFDAPEGSTIRFNMDMKLFSGSNSWSIEGRMGFLLRVWWRVSQCSHHARRNRDHTLRMEHLPVQFSNSG